MLAQVFSKKHICIHQLDAEEVGAGQPSCCTRGREAFLDEQNIFIKEMGCKSYSDLWVMSYPSPCVLIYWGIE